ncbi:hypothetical protein TEA_017581 [Camellia sinensis var. sinensis]|uniref:Uncharacterized protein n=1 Tax=Camellia sinensis var. sinensis TaxID=542762 RepID=A0A4S4EYW6_CAMSN|nr:hypothetical protein TEA_017581 [Camellia sinensis var. sinensis]
MTIQHDNILSKQILICTRLYVESINKKGAAECVMLQNNLTNMALTSIFESSFTEQRWISQISKIIAKEVNIEIDVPVSIFPVPTTLTVSKPEVYIPQLIGLGPYHHFRSELYEMERYKLAVSTRVQKQFRRLKFKQLVDKLNELEYEVRTCHHKYLDIDGETLAWIMAIDGLFLLDFLHSYVNKNDSLSSLSSTTAHLVC